ncbi:MAG: tRNA pseudouridine(38-40) synthase TruA [Bryobacterales bacterium]|nr:tRNA pseudouridine(38-40) synthase TruA [Bryobacterales bacterium]
MRRIKITLSYDGTEFHGWQVQPGLPTVQGALERVLSEIEGSSVDVHGSGRTDAGVHALAQVASFDLRNPIPPDNLRRAMNRLLPRSIRVLDVNEADASFHARFSAAGKTYEYRIYRGETCPPFLRLYVLHHPYALDEAAWIDAAGVYQGRHDFSAFAASDEKDELGHSKVRTIFSSGAERTGDLLVYRVHGSGFLKHMVRMMVGSLLEVGKGNLDGAALALRLMPGFEGKAGPSVPASGLFLVSVDYPSGTKPGQPRYDARAGTSSPGSV